jgi:hypothetical protein
MIIINYIGLSGHLLVAKLSIKSLKINYFNMSFSIDNNAKIFNFSSAEVGFRYLNNILVK